MTKRSFRSFILLLISTGLSLAAQFSAPVVFTPRLDANGFLARTPSYNALFSGTAPEFSIGRDRPPIRFRFEGASPAAHIAAGNLLPSKSSYFLGSDPAKWRRNISNYSSLRYTQVYRGVDAVFYGTGSEMEYDLEIAPGARTESIAISIAGAKHLSLDGEGNLVIVSSTGDTITHHRPRVLQNGETVECRYVLKNRTVRLAFGSYDRNASLTVDPVLTFATYLGGTRTDSATRMTVDGAGNVYLTGNTFSTDFPVSTGAARTTAGGTSDTYVTKFNSRGALVYSTYLGGTGGDLPAGIAIDSTGNAYITGTTTSTNFPVTAGAYQAASRGGTSGLDAFVTKINAAGTDLVYSTYLGGNDDELAFGIAVDSAGNAYATGTSASLNFPVTPNAYQSYTPGLPVYVTKFNPTGTALVYSTFVGGSRSDLASAIAVDSAGSAFVVGDTSSVDFPTTVGAYQTSNRGGASTRTDAFVFKLNPTGNALVYSTLLGGSGDELGTALAIDLAGNAYVGGRTASSDFPTSTGAFQKSLLGPTDAFIAKLNPTGTAIVFSTYYGGSRSDVALGIAADSAQNVYVGGATTSSGLSMTAASQPNLAGGQDGFVLKLNPAGNIVQSTYFGGPDDDDVTDIQLDGSGNAYLFGNTTSTAGISTAGAYQTKNAGGNSDVYLAKLNFSDEALSFTVAPLQLSFQGSAGNAPKDQALQITVPQGGFPVWQIDISTATGANWLSASPRNGSGTTTVQVSAAVGTLASGSYSGSILITNVTTAARITVPVTLAVSAPGGQITKAGIVNGGSFLSGPVAAGEIITIFGSGIGPATLTGLQLDSSGNVATTIAETRVLFDGVAAPLVYVSTAQVSAVVPYAVATKTSTQIQVEYKGLKSNAVAMQVAAASPAVFTADSSGKGNVAALNQDGSYNSTGAPAPKESVVVFYASGAGQTDPAGVDGRPANDVFPKPLLPVTVRIGGKSTEVLYSGAAPGFVAGVLQLNVRIPADVSPGSAALEVAVGSITTQAGVTIAVQ